MTHHSNHPGHQLTTLPFHPKPPHQGLPTRTSESPDFISGRSSQVSIPIHPTLLAGHIGHLGVQLRSATHIASSQSARAHLHAQAVLAEIQKELGSGGRIDGRSGRLPMLQKQLNHDLHIIEGDQTEASTAAAAFS